MRFLPEPIEWRAAAFLDPHDGAPWTVVLSSPQINDLLIHADGRCVFDWNQILIDAGQPVVGIVETLHHELFHVARGRRVPLKRHNRDHRFFAATSPIVLSLLRGMNVRMIPRLPTGWRRLQRSSIAWKAHQETVALEVDACG